MYKYDLNTGEPSNDGSPPGSLSEQEIVNNANLVGSYDIDPQQRLYNQQQMQYNQQMQSGYYNPAMQGFNQNYFGNNQGYNPYGYQQSGFGGYVGAPYQQNMYGYQYPQQQNYGFYQQNPYQYGYNQPYYQQPQYQDRSFYIPPFNTGSDILLKADAEEVCDKLQKQMEDELDEAYVSRLEKQKEYFKTIGYNGFNNNYVRRDDPAIQAKYRKMIDDMRQEARESRNNLNKRLSRAADLYLNGEVDEERINNIYSGQYVTIPGAKIQQEQEQYRWDQAQLVDPALPYQQADAQVSAAYGKYFNRDTDMATFFNEVGQVMVDEQLEEEMHRRRNYGDLYNGSTYKGLIKQKLYERHGLGGDNNTPQPNIQNMAGGKNIPMGNMVRTLDEAATLLDDGTLSVSAPEWLSNNMNVHINANENQYEIQRGRFRQSIMEQGITPPGGGNPDGS